MKTLRTAILSGLIVLFMVLGDDLAEAQSPASVPAHAIRSTDKDHWEITYQRPEDTATLVLTLSYKFWDTNVEGDAPTKKLLLDTEIKLHPGQQTIPIQISISKERSTLTVGKIVRPGKGYGLDASFVLAVVPQTNYDGVYVLAQKPINPKAPPAMGDTQNVTAWIELGISPQP